MPAYPLSTLRCSPYDEPTQDSGSQLVASHYYVGTFTLYPLPAFTGAFCLTPILLALDTLCPCHRSYCRIFYLPFYRPGCICFAHCMYHYCNQCYNKLLTFYNLNPDGLRQTITSRHYGDNTKGGSTK